MSSSVYKENRNLLNRFREFLNSNVKSKGLNGKKSDRIISVRLRPISSNVYSVLVDFDFRVNDILFEEVGNRVYFCMKLNEREEYREIRSSLSPRNTLSNLTDDWEISKSIITGIFVDNSYYPSSSYILFAKRIQQYFAYKGVMIGGNLDDSNKLDNFTEYFLNKNNKDKLIEIVDSPDGQEIQKFVKGIRNANLTIKRREKVFPKVKDTSLFPLGFFDANDYSISVPGKRFTSRNYTSMSFYNKYGLGEVADLNILFKNLARDAVLYFPLDEWVVLNLDNVKYSSGSKVMCNEQ